MRILVTGGAGYIGSHTCVELLGDGHDLVVVDSLANSSRKALDQVRAISGRELVFYQIDVADKDKLTEVFQKHKMDAVIHFAGFKAVGESVEKPLSYYRNNLDSTLTLCEIMSEFNVKKFVFSSSATVYGNPETVPIKEDAPLSCTNPYGWTKYMNEQILRDLHVADPDWSIVLLRYFNPAGAHESGLIGEDPAGIPNNLMPFIAQVAAGKLPYLQVFGDDYPTPDGTGIRDYIHVTDLARGHCRAVEHVLDNCGAEAINLGTGRGYSVLEMIQAFEEANKCRVPYKIAPRRPGDIAICYADPGKARTVLGWSARKDLRQMCEDSWRWQQKNPAGYGEG